jgi:hypothetical protein
MRPLVKQQFARISKITCIHAFETKFESYTAAEQR